MNHVEEGTLVAIRDGGLVSADAHVHVEECAACQAALADVRDRAEAVADALGSLVADAPVDVEAAKAEVRRRLDERRAAAHKQTPGLVGALGRAAVLLLMAAGVVYALPGSPLRGWLDDLASPTPASAPVEEAGPTPAEGVELDVPAGGLRIILTSVESGQRLEVTWSGGERARLVAASGSRYAVASGSVTAELAPGTVRLVLPRSSGSVTVEAGGRMLLSSVEGDLEVLGDVLSRDADRVVVSMGGG